MSVECNLTIQLLELKLYFNLADPDLTEKELDEMIMSYQRSSTEFNSTFEIMGWPRCAYTVSKVAVNAYTRILQKQLDQKGKCNLHRMILSLPFYKFRK